MQIPELGANLHVRLAGEGRAEQLGDVVRLFCPASMGEAYHNAQLDDYAELPRSLFPHHPPAQLALSARFSHVSTALCGTAGFGFWNDPFWMTRIRIPTLPQVCWFFFASERSNMPLALGTPGYGWKAATMDAGRWQALMWAPLAPAAVLLMRSKRLYRRIWPTIQKSLAIHEQEISIDLTEWHDYAIHWSTDGCQFLLDDHLVLETDASPRGPLGTVIWIDNQYMVATPSGRLSHGQVPNPDQWLELKNVQIRPD